MQRQNSDVRFITTGLSCWGRCHRTEALRENLLTHNFPKNEWKFPSRNFRVATGQQNKPMEALTNATAIEKNCNNSRTGTNCRVQRQSGKTIIMTVGQVERFTWRWRPRGRGGALSCVPLARAKSDCDCESKWIFMETLESRSGETTGRPGA